MSSPYQDSYGDDEYDERPVTPQWRYGSDDDLAMYRRHDTWYNYKTHLWECGCPAYEVSGRCKHVYRFRGQVTIRVNEEYL